MGVMGVRRLVLASVVVSCMIVGSSFSASVALAVSPPVVEEAFVSDVAGTSATLHARIDPEGSETTYRFEYGTSTSYGSDIPAPDGVVGSGTTGVAVSAHPQGLSPYTTYHYRVVALVASRSEVVPGSDGTFTTQRASGGFALPDGRQWELVSPPNKHGALIAQLKTTPDEGGPLQAAADGSGIAYQVNVPTEPEPAGYGQQGLIYIQARSDRGSGGWSTHDIAVPRDAPTGTAFGAEYLAFSRDLSVGLLYPHSEKTMLLSGEASEPTIYARREGLCDAPASASECYLPLVTGKEGFADVPPSIKFGGFGEVALEGGTPDMSKVVLKSFVALTPTPFPVQEGRGEGLYEWSAGAAAAERLQLVSVLPASEGGGPAPGNLAVGNAFASGPSGSRNSISRDGSRVFWGSQRGFPRLLYMRDTTTGESVRLDVQQSGAPVGGTPLARFQFASSDGSRVFFTDSQQLTAQSAAKIRGNGQWVGDLYECVIVEEAGGSRCDLTDLTPERDGQSAEVQKYVIGASEDGSYVYFVANAVLSENRNSEGETATQGECEVSWPSTCNLYVEHDGVVTFIARLSSEDEFDWDSAEFNFAKLTSRVSPDGRYVAFMSDRSLTGYDNRDASSGKQDIEVYMFDAQSGQLVCASCNPTGSRPVGFEAGEFRLFSKGKLRPNLVAIQPFGFSEVAGSYGEKNWVAANLPPGDGLQGGGVLYQPRALSDGGRLFFNSSDALVPQDVNGEEDVYEFEPEGTGNCKALSATFVARSGGCVSLISSGTSSEESAFLDASEGGGDVFFLTSSRLASQDVDTAVDLYDAHMCTASVPCVTSPVGPQPCSSGDSCKAAPSPQPSIFGAPASATFVGAGDVIGSSSVPGVKPRSLTRTQKLARALRACRKRPKRKRAMCERRARAQYSSVAGARGASARARG
jgi:hypothetical protein